MPRNEVMRHMLVRQNIGLITVRQVAEGIFNHVMTTNCIVDNRATLSNKGYALLLPLYLYPEKTKTSLFDSYLDANHTRDRRPNLALAFTTEISSKLNMQFIQDDKGDLQETFGPEDIFNYMYAVFYSPTYRTRYAEFLKIDFPRLPLTSDTELFRWLCKLGERLVGLHLMEKLGKSTPNYPEQGNNVVEKIEYREPVNQSEQGRVYINKTQYFDSIPPEVWAFHVGGYQVCYKWLKDRKGRALSYDDIKHYQRIIAALAETITLMEKIDEMIEEHGGWPIE